MSADKKQQRPKARLAKGFRDVGPDEVRGVKRMMRVIGERYRHGCLDVGRAIIGRNGRRTNETRHALRA